jgi:hypothetical protein
MSAMNALRPCPRTRSAPWLLALAGCANGWHGQPSIAESPAGAAELALEKAMQASRRESSGALCFRDAVLPGSVERRPFAFSAMSSAVPSADAEPLSTEQARRLVNATDASLVPVYCRNAEPTGVQPTKPAAAKLRDAARWLDSVGLVVSSAPVDTLVRSVGDARYKEVEFRDSGYRHETVIGRYRYWTPITSVSVYAMPQAGTVDVPGRYTEAWAVVRVPREKARAYRAACAAMLGASASSPPQTTPRFEAVRACEVYHPGHPALQRERPAIVPLNPEERS